MSAWPLNHPVATLPPSTPIEQLKVLLKQTIRVTIHDGRIFLGTFVGTDKQLNILLVNTDEFRIGADSALGNPNGRFVGQVLVPWRLVKRVEARTGNGTGYGRRDSDDESMYM